MPPMSGPRLEARFFANDFSSSFGSKGGECFKYRLPVCFDLRRFLSFAAKHPGKPRFVLDQIQLNQTDDGILCTCSLHWLDSNSPRDCSLAFVMISPWFLKQIKLIQQTAA
ncbi:unnamed protein product [Polarella glacialis]|uniref:Uncharacterized protein n=1 Tax=Polarella glacialis TaxID=89957 RepID=A0A813LMN8_POLGL|nr:unnamed protein product [Polarella glacialis]